MKRLIVLMTLVWSLTFVTTALAAENYASPRPWAPGEAYGSSWKSSWVRNLFHKNQSGWDSTVTFIDNVSYSWHWTVRNKDLVTRTYWYAPSQVKRAHCKANVGGHWGACYVE